MLFVGEKKDVQIIAFRKRNHTQKDKNNNNCPSYVNSE